MSTLIERLRRNADDQTICGVDVGRTGSCHAAYTMDEAADTIESLQAEKEKLHKWCTKSDKHNDELLAEIDCLKTAMGDALYHIDGGRYPATKSILTSYLAATSRSDSE